MTQAHASVAIPLSTERGDVVELQFDVPPLTEAWYLEDDEQMPESQPHDLTLDLLKGILQRWAVRSGRSIQIPRNLAFRWNQAEPRVGIDPDLCVIEPPTPEGDELTSLRTWLPGHTAPRLAIEVVSPSTAEKDYTVSLDKYASSGALEVWVFDPRLKGPEAHGGPFVLQVWRRVEGTFRRQYAGTGPARSAYLDAWLVVTDSGARLRIADDAAGSQLWQSAEEAEQAAQSALESERAALESERAAKEAALARIAELERQLAEKD